VGWLGSEGAVPLYYLALVVDSSDVLINKDFVGVVFEFYCYFVFGAASPGENALDLGERYHSMIFSHCFDKSVSSYGENRSLVDNGAGAGIRTRAGLRQRSSYRLWPILSLGSGLFRPGPPPLT